MDHQVNHFVFTADGQVREVDEKLAQNVASRLDRLPEYAALRVRYLQISIEKPNPNGETEELRVQASGACIEFDEQGLLKGAVSADTDAEKISPFEADTCIQWVLRDHAIPPNAIN